MAKEIITKVEFKVADKLMIADPCYVDQNDTIDDLERLGVVLSECEGTWVAEVEISDEKEWGKRVSILRATRCGSEHTPFVTTTWDHVADNGVDSGQMYIGCLSNFPLDYDAVVEHYKLPSGEWDNDLNFFAHGEGAVSSTGYGDGVYPVYVRRDINGRPIAVEIRFLEDEEEEDDYDG